MTQLFRPLRNSIIIGLALMNSSCVHAPHSYLKTQDELVVEMKKRAVLYFVENAHPNTGLVLDGAPNFGATLSADERKVASLASTGFGLAVISHAGKTGLYSKDRAYEYCLKTLKFVRDHVPHYKGWTSHFVDWSTGQTMWNSEYSTIDTALFLAGALFAAQIFPDSEVSRLAHELHTRADFMDMLTNGGSQPKKLTLSMGYKHGGDGYIQNGEWSHYCELMVLLFLGLGHPTHAIPRAAWDSWTRPFLKSIDGQWIAAYDEALFTHQYSQLFIDFRKFEDTSPIIDRRFSPLNYFTNTAAITRSHRQLAHSLETYESWRQGFWGMSAGVSPRDYDVYTATRTSSTVCIGCTLGSAAFLKKEVLEDALDWVNGPYKDQIWGRYGFTDSIDIDQKWFSKKVLGITVGPLYMSLADLDDAQGSSFWALGSETPYIKKAFQEILKK